MDRHPHFCDCDECLNGGPRPKQPEAPIVKVEVFKNGAWYLNVATYADDDYSSAAE